MVNMVLYQMYKTGRKISDVAYSTYVLLILVDFLVKIPGIAYLKADCTKVRFVHGIVEH